MGGLRVDESREWRNDLKYYWSDKVEFLDPTREFNLYGIAEDALTDTYINSGPATTSTGITIRDFTDVSRCDLMLVNLNEHAGKVSQGTLYEIAWAYALRKPIVAAMDKGNIHAHPMIYHQTIIVNDIEEAVLLAMSILNV